MMWSCLGDDGYGSVLNYDNYCFLNCFLLKNILK